MGVRRGQSLHPTARSVGRWRQFLQTCAVVQLTIDGSLLLPLLAVVVNLSVLVGYIHEALGNGNYILVPVGDTQLLKAIGGLRSRLLVVE